MKSTQYIVFLVVDLWMIVCLRIYDLLKGAYHLIVL